MTIRLVAFQLGNQLFNVYQEISFFRIFQNDMTLSVVKEFSEGVNMLYEIEYGVS